MTTSRERKPKRWELYKLEMQLPELRTDDPIGLYPRQSTMKQLKNNRQSYEKQTQDNIEDLIKRGWTRELIRVYDKDNGRSAARPIEDREDMNQMLADIRNRVIRTVRASEVDRLFRDEDRIDSNWFIKICREADCLVMTDRMTYDLRLPRHQKWFRDEVDRAWEFYESQILIRAHQYRDRAQSQGYYTGGTVPVGFIVDKNKGSLTYKKFIPYTPHSQRIIEIFLWFYDCGGILGALINKLDALPYVFPLEEDWVRENKLFTTNLEYAYGTELDEDGKPKPIGYRLTETGVRRILRNRVYIGDFPYDGDYIPNNHLAIVPRDLWDFAQERLDANEEAFTRNHYTQTPSVVHSVLYPASPEGVKRYLSLRNEKGVFEIVEQRNMSRVRIGSINAELLEEIFVQKFTEKLRDTKLFEDYDQKVADPEEEKQEQERRENMQGLIKELTERIDGLFLTLQSPKLEPEDRNDYVEERSRLIKRRKKLQEELKAETPMETYLRYKDLIILMGKHWKKYPLEDKQSLAALLLKGVSLERLTSHFWKIVIEWKAFPEDIGIIWNPRSAAIQWTPEEDRTLRGMYATAHPQALLDALPRRDWRGILDHAHELRKASKEDDLILACRKQYTTMREVDDAAYKLSKENFKIVEEYGIPIEMLGGTPFVQWSW
jgi:hypothetical protein